MVTFLKNFKIGVKITLVIINKKLQGLVISNTGSKTDLFISSKTPVELSDIIEAQSLLKTLVENLSIARIFWGEYGFLSVENFDEFFAQVEKKTQTDIFSRLEAL